MRDDLLDVLAMYPDFARHFNKNLKITCDLRDEEFVERLEKEDFNCTDFSKYASLRGHDSTAVSRPSFNIVESAAREEYNFEPKCGNLVNRKKQINNEQKHNYNKQHEDDIINCNEIQEPNKTSNNNNLLSPDSCHAVFDKNYNSRYDDFEDSRSEAGLRNSREEKVYISETIEDFKDDSYNENLCFDGGMGDDSGNLNCFDGLTEEELLGSFSFEILDSYMIEYKRSLESKSF